MSEFPYPYDTQLPPIKRSTWQVRLLPNHRRLAVQLVVLAALFALANTTTFPAGELSRGQTSLETWMGFTIGLIGAEAGLLAIAAVMGPGRWHLRHLVVAGVAVLWIVAWFVGFGLTRLFRGNGYYGPTSNDMFAVILVIPVMFCACEIPLWIFRAFLRWRIEPAIGSGDSSKPPQFSIAGILIATSAVAIALAGVRMGRTIEGSASEAEWWGACGIAIAFSGGISFVTLPLAVWGTLRCPSLRAGIVAIVASLFVAAVGLICVISVLVGDWPPNDLDFWLPTSGVVGGFACGLLGTLTLVRISGYRLFWGRETVPSTISTSAAPSAVPASPQP